MAPETATAIIQITGGNVRRMNRLLAETERILEINALEEVTKAIVAAAGETLVLGHA